MENIMDILTATIAEEIKKQYKSVRSFANAINIPEHIITPNKINCKRISSVN